MTYRARTMVARRAAAAGQPAPARNLQGVLILAIGFLAFTLAMVSFALRAAHPAFTARMFDLGIYRDGGLIVRHAYHFRSGHPTPLYRWVSPGGNPFTYPPFAAGIFAVLSCLPLAALQWGMTAVNVAALVTAIWRTLASAGVRAGLTGTGVCLAVSAVALWTQPVQADLGLGQINLLLMAAIIWDLRPAGPAAADSAALRGRWAGAATGIAAGIKLTPLLFVPYLLVTRRYRAAAVATGTFAATAAVGFLGLPGASATFWGQGLFARAGGNSPVNVAFFFGSARNQSLRALLTRLTQHTQTATVPWLIAVVLVGVVGLLCAVWLHNDGYPLLGLLTCALTGLLISPVSWDHHWVWAGAWLAALAGLALRAGRESRWMWLTAAALIVAVFVEWPRLPLISPATRGYGLIRDVPIKSPFTWHGTQLIAGNAYVIVGLAGLLVLFGWGAIRAFQPVRVAATHDDGSELDGIQRGDGVPEAMTYRK